MGSRDVAINLIRVCANEIVENKEDYSYDDFNEIIAHINTCCWMVVMATDFNMVTFEVIQKILSNKCGFNFQRLVEQEMEKAKYNG